RQRPRSQGPVRDHEGQLRQQLGAAGLQPVSGRHGRRAGQPRLPGRLRRRPAGQGSRPCAGCRHGQPDGAAAGHAGAPAVPGAQQAGRRTARLLQYHPLPGAGTEQGMTEHAVLFEERAAGGGKRIAFAQLNAEKSLNALNQTMIDLLRPRLAAWAEDPAIACVVLSGSGDKAFCAGGDIIGLYRAMREHPGGPNPLVERFFETEYRLDYQIHTYPKPILCWGHGIVMGGGLGLMAGASHRVATERSRIAMPELGIGFFRDVGASWFLNRMPGRLGLYLGLTGSTLNATDALYAGLADYFVPAAQRDAVF